MTKEDRKNAYLYCKFRDEQFALYDSTKRHGMMMKTLLVVNVLFYAKDGMTQKDICQRTFQSKQTVNLIIKNLLAKVCNCHRGAGKQAEQDRPDDRCRKGLLRKGRAAHHLGWGHGHVHVYAGTAATAHRPVPDIHQKSDHAGRSGKRGLRMEFYDVVNAGEASGSLRIKKFPGMFWRVS